MTDTEIQKIASQVAKILISELAPLLPDPGSTPHHNREWFSTEETAAMLGLAEQRIRELRNTMGIRLGYHYRNTSAGSRPTYQWHVARIQEFLSKPAHKRGIR